MPVANYDQYCQMLDSAAAGGYAFPAINVTSTSTANAAIKAFADLKSDGIIQVSTGGGKFASGQLTGDMALGAISLAQHVHLVAEKANVCIALHTDHCHPQYVDSFMIPLIEETERRRANGQTNLFNSHMYDGSELPLEENIKVSAQLLERCAKNQIILEMETGVVGGEEDGVNNEDLPADKLYTTPEEIGGRFRSPSPPLENSCTPRLLEMSMASTSQAMLNCVRTSLSKVKMPSKRNLEQKRATGSFSTVDQVPSSQRFMRLSDTASSK